MKESLTCSLIPLGQRGEIVAQMALVINSLNFDTVVSLDDFLRSLLGPHVVFGPNTNLDMFKRFQVHFRRVLLAPTLRDASELQGYFKAGVALTFHSTFAGLDVILPVWDSTCSGSAAFKFVGVQIKNWQDAVRDPVEMLQASCRAQTLGKAGDVDAVKSLCVASILWDIRRPDWSGGALTGPSTHGDTDLKFAAPEVSRTFFMVDLSSLSKVDVKF
jgi:hypothetical protein